MTRLMLRWISTAALLTWCVLAAVSALLDARSRARDPVPQLDAVFSSFAPELPLRGQIGFLEPYDGGSEDLVRTHYVAQYALIPRLVIAQVGPEFLIVSPGTARPGGDRRLDGFYPVAEFPGGHRLYRRLLP